MKDAGLTKQERNFLALLRVLIILFLLAAVTFAIAPNWLLNYLSAIGRTIFEWRENPLNLNQNRFWSLLASSFLFTLAYISFFIQHDFLRRIDYSKTIIIAKAISAIGFLTIFILIERRFLYLVGVVVDGLIFIATLTYYRSALKSRSR